LPGRFAPEIKKINQKTYTGSRIKTDLKYID